MEIRKCYKSGFELLFCPFSRCKEIIALPIVLWIEKERECMRDYIAAFKHDLTSQRSTHIIDQWGKSTICLSCFTFLLLININKNMQSFLWTSVGYMASTLSILCFLSLGISCVLPSLYISKSSNMYIHGILVDCLFDWLTLGSSYWKFTS